MTPNLLKQVIYYPSATQASSNQLPIGAGSILPMSSTVSRLQQVLSKNLRFLNGGVGVDGRYSGANAQKKCGLAAKTFNNMLNGRHISKVDSIEKVARLFGVEPWELLREDFIENQGQRDKWLELSRAGKRVDPAKSKELVRQVLQEFDRKDVADLISEYIDDDKLYQSELNGVVAAVELLLPENPYKTWMTNQLRDGVSSYQIAKRLMIPQNYIEYRMSVWGLS